MYFTESSSPSPSVSKLIDIHVDDFSPKIEFNLPDKKLFFLTKCDDPYFKMIEGDFLTKLEQSETWTVYMSELTFGYLRYTAEAKTQWWNPEISSDIIDSLYKSGKIVVLLKNIPLNIEKLCIGKVVVTATYSSSELNCQITLETYYQAESGWVHVGSKSLEDMLTVPRWPDALTIDKHSPWSRLQDFANGLEKIKVKIDENPCIQFELIIRSSDKLTDLWYLRRLWEEFRHQVHVTKEYYQFITEFVPEMSEMVSSDNKNENCRFHYDCCQLTTNEDCVPGLEWATDFDVDEIWIGWNNEELYPGDQTIRLAFIHELSEELM